MLGHSLACNVEKYKTGELNVEKIRKITTEKYEKEEMKECSCKEKNVELKRSL